MLSRLLIKTITADTTTPAYQHGEFKVAFSMLCDKKYEELRRYIEPFLAGIGETGNPTQKEIKTGLLLLSGFAYFYDVEFDKACHDLNAAVSLTPGLTEAYVLQAEIQWQRFNFADVLQTFETIRKFDSTYFRYLQSKRAIVFFKLGDLGEAMASARSALSVCTSSADAHYILAKSMIVLGNYHDVELNLTQALTVNNNHIALLATRAEVRLRTKQFREALEDVTSVITIAKVNISEYKKYYHDADTGMPSVVGHE